jgi:hypothetical protein
VYRKKTPRNAIAVANVQCSRASSTRAPVLAAYTAINASRSASTTTSNAGGVAPTLRRKTIASSVDERTVA